MSKSVVVVNKESICKRLADGEYMKDIAADLGVTPAAVSYQLREDKDYLNAKEAGIEYRLDKAAGLLESVTLNEHIGEDGKSIRDSLDLARIYEIGLKRQEWRASVEVPNRWGQKPVAIQINNTSTSDALETDVKELLTKLKPVNK